MSYAEEKAFKERNFLDNHLLFDDSRHLRLNMDTQSKSYPHETGKDQKSLGDPPFDLTQDLSSLIPRFIISHHSSMEMDLDPEVKVFLQGPKDLLVECVERTLTLEDLSDPETNLREVPLDKQMFLVNQGGYGDSFIIPGDMDLVLTIIKPPTIKITLFDEEDLSLGRDFVPPGRDFVPPDRESSRRSSGSSDRSLGSSGHPMMSFDRSCGTMSEGSGYFEVGFCDLKVSEHCTKEFHFDASTREVAKRNVDIFCNGLDKVGKKFVIGVATFFASSNEFKARVGGCFQPWSIHDSKSFPGVEPLSIQEKAQLRVMPPSDLGNIDIVRIHPLYFRAPMKEREKLLDSIVQKAKDPLQAFKNSAGPAWGNFENSLLSFYPSKHFSPRLNFVPSRGSQDFTYGFANPLDHDEGKIVMGSKEMSKDIRKLARSVGRNARLIDGGVVVYAGGGGYPINVTPLGYSFSEGPSDGPSKKVEPFQGHVVVPFQGHVVVYKSLAKKRTEGVVMLEDCTLVGL